jgi:neutral ceramidase
MELKIGTGKYDITGPCVKLGFMGMSNVFQEGRGLHTRLFSRAFVIQEIQSGNRIVIVCADIACCTIAIKQAVLKKLAADENFINDNSPIYKDDNVLICATHTHCGPGGYSHFLTYNASIKGFNKENFNIIVNGIYLSICRANENMFPGRIKIASGNLEECGKIRSYDAFTINKEVDEDLIPDKENVSPLHKEMVLLRFEDEAGNGRGAINWFGVHATNMGEKTKLISSDNKGYAQELFEKEFGVVSAFANSCCGDISPNAGKDENGVKYGRPDGIHDTERAAKFGRKQFDKARDLYGNTSENLGHELEYRHTWVDMSAQTLSEPEISVEAQESGDQVKRTWPAAMGFGMVNGSQEDSSGLDLKFWGEGTTCDNIQANPELFKWIVKSAASLFGIKWPKQIDQSIIEGHKKKEILFPLGLIKRKKNPIAPSILPLQILRIGSLIIAAHPGEMTDVAGIRMRDKIGEVFKNDPRIKHVVISTYANAFASYTTTPEEYHAQHYEGASTLYGPYAFKAFEQENRRLAKAMRDNLPVDGGPGPEELKVKKISNKKTALPGADCDLPGLGFGEIEIDAKPSYGPNETVKVTFLGGHPNRDFRTGQTYFEVLKRTDGSWQQQYSDNDFCTRMHWNRRGRASVIRVEWDIPGEGEVDSGIYKIVSYTLVKERRWLRNTPFKVESREFRVG